MKKKLLAVALLSVLATPAFAAEESKGPYVAVSAGIAPGVTFDAASNTTTAAGLSYGAYFGYQFNPIFSIEGGYTSLLNSSKVSVAGADAGYSISISGTEFAGIISIPMNRGVTPFLRVGAANMNLTDSIFNTASTYSGQTYGIGAQFNLNGQTGMRVGYNAYNLTASSVTTTFSNVYGSLIFKF